MIKAQLAFIWFKKHREPKLDMLTLLNNYCMVFNFTDLNENSIFDALKVTDQYQLNSAVIAVEQAFDKCDTLTDFLLKSLRWFDNITDARLNRDAEQFSWLYDNKQNQEKGALWYEASGSEMYFHISNEFYPSSFLDEDNHFEDSIKKMAEYAKANGVEEIICSSWLNQFPKFLSYFPSSWTESATFCNDVIDGELGIWGQFIDHNYQVNERTYIELKEKEDIPFYMTTCKIKTNELLEYYK